MMDWFSIVRVTNVQTMRWVLGALNGWDRPVSTRQAQSWCARMQSAGYIDRVNLGGAGGSVVWATFAGIGRSKPDIYRQTTRHEIAVSTACARYAAAGYAWQRDERAQHPWEHQADGVAIGPDWVELIEVGLTAKRPVRYDGIFRAFRRRLPDEVSQITYLCNADAGRALRAALDGAAIKQRVQVHDVFDRQGHWGGEALPDWLIPVEQRASDRIQPMSAARTELAR
jgi:hypothetical protein